MSPTDPTPTAPLPRASAQPSFRSSTVARLAGMPVSTLRIWEQRYQAVAPTTAPSGHRMYSPADVERVVALRQLTRQGHAIGSLAGLELDQLRSLVQADTAAPPPASERPQPGPARRIVVVGQALAHRLQRPAVLQRWPSPPLLVGVFDSLAHAMQATPDATDLPIDLLVWQASGLQADALPELQAAQRVWCARHVAVAYRFAGSAARDALLNAGASVVHEPSDDAALVAWLSSLEPALAASAQAGSLPADLWSIEAPGLGGKPAPARRFDDATLTEFAGMSSSIACECPSHVAELLLQLSGFERYSAGCSSRSPADAELHAYLQRVAGAARVLFEAALERVAIAEGLDLPRGQPA